jgi:hypothetical protein
MAEEHVSFRLYLTKEEAEAVRESCGNSVVTKTPHGLDDEHQATEDPFFYFDVREQPAAAEYMRERLAVLTAEQFEERKKHVGLVVPDVAESLRKTALPSWTSVKAEKAGTLTWTSSFSADDPFFVALAAQGHDLNLSRLPPHREPHVGGILGKRGGIFGEYVMSEDFVHPPDEDSHFNDGDIFPPVDDETPSFDEIREDLREKRRDPFLNQLTELLPAIASIIVQKTQMDNEAAERRQAAQHKHELEMQRLQNDLVCRLAAR